MNSNPSQPGTASISLPPISSMDSYHQQLSHSPHDYHQMVPRQLPAPYPNMNPMPRHDPLPTRPIYPGGTPYQMGPGRMALPPSTDPSLMIASRIHKTKEVKRRTKTGCMTCRKRRIKCDEGRPTCKNCQKSKRECLGYDPVFQAQQASSTPANPQTVPASNPVNISASPGHLIHPYSTQQPSSPSVSSQAPSVLTESSLDQVDYAVRTQYRSAHDMDMAHGQSMDYLSRHNNIRTAKIQSVDALCTIANHHKPVLPPLPSDPPNKDAIQDIYSTAFASGLDKFLETRWYSQHGFSKLLANRDLLAQFLAYITFIHNGQQTTSDALASQEARIVWSLLWLVHDAADLYDGGQNVEIGPLVTSLDAFRALITGETMRHPSPMATTLEIPSSSSTLDRQVMRRRSEFWTSFNGFVSRLRRQAAAELDTAGCEADLEACRTRLDSLENRDVIYSIMLMQYLSKREELGLNRAPSSSQDPHSVRHTEKETSAGSDDEYRRKRQEDWATAQGFLLREASGRGRSLVCANIAGMALRAWDWAGLNGRTETGSASGMGTQTDLA